mmetsp:Transcript_77125/g.223846  ORF Transcript_77125/g.223846 Transcript_77125/m.223846 type:complete len:222 (+) Transcript_77125:1101-1766(+)
MLERLWRMLELLLTLLILLRVRSLKLLSLLLLSLLVLQLHMRLLLVLELVALRRASVQRHHHVAMSLQAHGADVMQARVLEQLGELGVPERGLRELQMEAGSEKPLHVRERHKLGSLRHGGDDLLQTCPDRVPTRKGARAFRGGGARLPALGALLFDHRLGPAVRHDRAIQVAEQLLLGYGQLHDVAHLAEGTALQEGQPPAHKDLRARVPPPRKHHISVI